MYRFVMEAQIFDALNGWVFLEIDMGINRVPEDMVLIVYAHFNRQIQIDGDRKLTIIE